MKLSDVKGERTLDVVAEIIEPIANIAEDEAAADLFKREKLPDGITAQKFFIKRAKKAVPALMKNHKRDLIQILSAIEGVSPEEYAGVLNLPKLFKDCIELLTDNSFEALFTSTQSETSSGSALEIIEGQEL